jgi:DHA1 family inner membrane transport protein
MGASCEPAQVSGGAGRRRRPDSGFCRTWGCFLLDFATAPLPGWREVDSPGPKCYDCDTHVSGQESAGTRQKVCEESQCLGFHTHRRWSLRDKEARLSDTTLRARLSGHKVTLRLGVASVARLFFNTALRLGYPFAPALSRGLGVPLTSITSMLAAQQMTGLFGLVSGPLSDRAGPRKMMLAGSAMLAGGMLVGGALGVYWGVLLALFLAGLGKVCFDPAVISYIGEWVPYENRGRAIGLSEFAWAGSLLVGVPLVGLLISQVGWRSPFFLLGGVGLLSAAAVMILFPRDPQQPQSVNIATGLWQSWRRVGGESVALFTLAFSLLVSASNQILFVVYGAWMEESFGLSIVALGTLTIVIGVAELLGEGLTASIADRMGLKRAVVTGSLVLVLGYLLLPVLGGGLAGAMVGLFIIFLCYEFTIVTTMSLVSEILPGARATVLSGNMVAASLGRVIGVAVGGFVWLAGGLAANCLVAAVVAGLAVVCLVLGLRGWRTAAQKT